MQRSISRHASLILFVGAGHWEAPRESPTNEHRVQQPSQKKKETQSVPGFEPGLWGTFDIARTARLTIGLRGKRRAPVSVTPRMHNDAHAPPAQGAKQLWTS